MYEKIESCPSCTSKEFTNFTICDDHLISGESFAIMRCQNCDLLLTNPRPSPEHIGKYYESKDYISHTDKGNTIVNRIYKIVRNITIRTKYKLIQPLAESKTILDYGCGTGLLLKYFKDKKWEVIGVEPSPSANAIAQKTLDQNIPTQLSEVTANKISIITLWHVLEHVHDLSNTLSQLHKKLSSKGRLIVAVPNHESYDRKFYKENWAAYDVPRHLYHFNQHTIKELMKFHSFQLVETIPMKYDSYYVSMLSEKNKTGKNKLLKSMIIGWISNQWAKRHDNNYSSLIYIFKKV